MTTPTKVAVALLVAAASLAPHSEAAAQERIVVEERTGEVLRVVGRTVIIRNDLGEVKKYVELPEDVKLFVDGEPAEIDDLEEGMKLHAVRWENVPAPVLVSEEELRRLGLPARRIRPRPVIEYRHSDRWLDSAMRFVAETVTEDSYRIAKPDYRVSVSGFCTLRFDRLDAGGWRVPVHVVNLSHLDPRESDQFERMICFETTSLRNTIAYYELPVEPDWTYSYHDSPIADTRGARDRFCFHASRSNSHRVARALNFAMDACRARSVW